MITIIKKELIKYFKTKNKFKKLKNIRGIFKTFSNEFEDNEFVEILKSIIPGLELSLKDLRSQVCKEACITISLLFCNLINYFSYISKITGNKFGPYLEYIANTAISLFSNTSKVISCSAACCICICVKHTVDPKLICVLKSTLEFSKAKEIRKYYNINS